MQTLLSTQGAAVRNWGHRTYWPRNPFGGYKLGPNITKYYHGGIRCYGFHRDGKCTKYVPEPLKNPLPAGVFIPSYDWYKQTGRQRPKEGR